MVDQSVHTLHRHVASNQPKPGIRPESGRSRRGTKVPGNHDWEISQLKTSSLQHHDGLLTWAALWLPPRPTELRINDRSCGTACTDFRADAYVEHVNYSELARKRRSVEL